jgi:dephospho-CoA kinase
LPTQNRDFLLVGVTGGIGSGKSSVCTLFAALGRIVLSADRIARDLVETDPEIISGIQKDFGKESYLADGTLDRRRMAERVFTRPRERVRLNRIVHPRVFREIDRQLSAVQHEARRPFVIVEAALIYESGMHKQLDRVIVVDAEEDLRIQRVIERDSCSREEVLRRIASQMPVAEKRKLADFIILNNGSLEDLKPKVAFFDVLLSKA